jgi:glycosyltransferase involved in cell wall biosynthesis
MNVLALIPNQKGFSPGQRGSIELWERVLEPAGIHLHWAPFETPRLREILYQPGLRFEKAKEMLRGYVERLGLLKQLDEYDAVFVYREAALLGPAFLEKWIARQGKPIIYQLDDPLYVPYRSPSNGYFSYLKFFGKIAEIIRLSRVVIVNSSQIREYAAQYNERIWQIPSIVDTEKYFLQPRSTECATVCIGWSGSATTVGNMAIVADALRELAERVAHRVHLIGGGEFDLPGVRYTAQQWSALTEVEDLRKMQIGMVPLPVNEWNKRKFYMKSAQYMALGIPPVCTPLGSNPEVIEHGRTGFLANTTDEWVDCLEQLISDPVLRENMAYNAAQVARDRFSLQANAGKIIEAFRSAIN